MGDAIYPQMAPLIQMIKSNKFSFWLAAQGAGTDLLGNLNSPIINILLFLSFPASLAHSLIFLLVTAVAFFSMLYFLKFALRLNNAFCLIGAALFSLWFEGNGGGYVYTWATGLAYALAPLVVLHLINVNKVVLGTLYSICLGIGVGVGGHYTWSIFLMGTIFLTCVVIRPSKIFQWGPYFVLILAVISLIQAPFVWANLSTMAYSGRLSGDPLYIGQSIKQLFFSYSIGTPPWYPQVPMMLLALAVLIPVGTIARIRKVSNPPNFSLPLALGGLAILLPLIDSVLPYIFSSFNLAGFHFLNNGVFGGPFDFRFRHGGCFLACAVTAICLNNLWVFCAGKIRSFGSISNLLKNLKGNSKLRRSFAQTTFFSILMSSILIEIIPHENVFSYYFNQHKHYRDLGLAGNNFLSYYEHPDLIALANLRPDFSSYRVASLEVDARDESVPGFNAGFQTSYGFQIADAYMSNIPSRYIDYWYLMLTGFPSSMPSEFKAIYQQKFENFDSAFKMKLFLYEPAHSRFLTNSCQPSVKSVNFDQTYNSSLLSLANVEYIISTIPINSPHLSLLPSSTRDQLLALNCKSKEEKINYYQTNGLYGRPLYIYQNHRVVPRVFSPNSIEGFDTQQALFNTLSTMSLSELKNTVLVMTTENITPKLLHSKQSLKLNILSYTSTKNDIVSIKLEPSSNEGIIILSNNYSPFWKATSNGLPLHVFPAYNTFIGIEVPPNASNIEVTYSPPYAKWLLKN